jgi:DNA mismatch repair protein MutS
MDEVGRGTGTKDGLSIAWAVCEELLDRIRCRTLFATHYHELSMINHPRMINRSMEVVDRDGELIFLRRLIEGSAAESYGLEVAKLAGISGPVLSRARELLNAINENERKLGKLHAPGSLPAQGPETPELSEEGQTSLSEEEAQVLNELRSLDTEHLTPLSALNLLYLWKTIAFDKQDKAVRSRRSSSGNADSAQKKNASSILNTGPELFDSY